MSNFKKTLLISSLLFSNTLIAAEPPKYVIYLIGDGMATTQRQIAEYYQQTINNDKTMHLAMNQLPVTGITTTHSNDSLITDSAAAGTALATGEKTGNGVIGQLPNGTTLTSLLEGAQERGMATGVVTTTRLTHATPAAFVAKNMSRSNENEIADDYVTSDVDYFAGGGYRHFITGEGSKRTDDDNLVAQLKESDYHTFIGQAGVDEFRDYKPNQGDRVFASLTSSHMPYELDRMKNDSVPSLEELTEKGIALLSQDEAGFFMLVEGGRIDHASHANDAAGTIYDTLAFDQAVEAAVTFYNQHPKETLVVVTGDHETGGMGMGFGDQYFLTLDQIEKSHESIEDKLNGTYQGDSDAFYQHIASAFSLTDLTKEEKSLINKAMAVVDEQGEKAMKDYGGYDPVAIAVAHITSKRAGVYWTSYAHTATQLPLSAIGVGADKLAGFKDNTEVAKTMADIMQVEIGI